MASKEPFRDEKSVKVGSLGWITESTMPRKRASRSIAVADGERSSVSLRAAMLQVQAEARRSGGKKRRRPTNGVTHKTLFRQKTKTRRNVDTNPTRNAGVDARRARDADTERAEIAFRQSQLRSKADLYEKMKRGEFNHRNALVDFEAKGLSARPDAMSTTATHQTMQSRSTRDEAERLQWERQAREAIESGGFAPRRRPIARVGGVKGRFDRNLTRNEKQILEQVSREAVAARAAGSSQPSAREAALEARKQMLFARDRRDAQRHEIFRGALQRFMDAKAGPEKLLPSTTSRVCPRARPIIHQPTPNKHSPLKAYRYRSPSPDAPPESRPNPHRDYAAIPPPPALTTHTRHVQPSPTNTRAAINFLNSLGPNAASAPPPPRQRPHASRTYPLNPEGRFQPTRNPLPQHGFSSYAMQSRQGQTQHTLSRPNPTDSKAPAGMHPARARMLGLQ